MTYYFHTEDDVALYNAIRDDDVYMRRLAGVIDWEREHPGWTREGIIDILANMIRNEARAAYSSMIDEYGPFAAAMRYWRRYSFVDIAEALYEDIVDDDAVGSESLRSAMSSAYGRGREAVSKVKAPAKKTQDKKAASKSCKSKTASKAKSKGARR